MSDAADPQAEPVADPLVALSLLPGVGSAYAAAQDAVDAVLRALPRRGVPADRSRAALVATTLASADLEPEPDRWRVGAERLGPELPDLARRLRVAPGMVLARMHLLLARGELPTEALGRVVDEVDTARVAGLTRLLTDRSAAPVVVLAAVVHAELATLRPFGPGSGIVARAVEHCVLIGAGTDPVGMIMVEAAHAEAGPAYASALEAYAQGSPIGVTTWLRHDAAAVARGAELSPGWSERGRTSSTAPSPG